MYKTCTKTNVYERYLLQITELAFETKGLKYNINNNKNIDRE